MNINNNVNVAPRKDSGPPPSGADAPVKSQAHEAVTKAGGKSKEIDSKNFSQTLQAQKQRATAEATTAAPGATAAAPATAPLAPADPSAKTAKQKSDADKDDAPPIDVSGLLALLPVPPLSAPAVAVAAATPAAGAATPSAGAADAGRQAGAPLSAVTAAAAVTAPGVPAAAPVGLPVPASTPAGLIALAQKNTAAATTGDAAHDLSALASTHVASTDATAAANPAASMVSLNALLSPPPLAAAPVGVHSATLTLDPGHADWAGQVGQQVLLTTSAGLQKAELHLHPADLGMVHVNIRIEGGNTGIVFTAEHPAARAALEQSMPQLRDLFNQQGLTLTQTQVFSQMPGDQPGARPQTFRPTATRHDQRTEPVAAEPLRISRRGLLDDYA
ncbi:MAG: flagellar hook-length control protein FliK [Stenotrophobium sp.]